VVGPRTLAGSVGGVFDLFSQPVADDGVDSDAELGDVLLGLAWQEFGQQTL
jgi:hypothetical protein